MKKYTIIKTTPEYIRQLLSTEHDGKYGTKVEHFERFYYKDRDRWCGCDNNDGDCWIEEFDDIGRCLAWLIGEEDL